MFLPYKADVVLVKLPVVTLSVCILCVLVFWAQMKSEREYENKIKTFCTENVDQFSRQMIDEVAFNKKLYGCAQLFVELSQAKEPHKEIDAMVASIKPKNLFQDVAAEKLYMTGKFEEMLAIFQRDIPNNLTDDLAYKPAEYKVWRMITSTFTHGDFMHIAGNILFFYMFAATLEVIIGSFVYVGVFFLLAIVTSLSYSYSVSGGLDAPPTIGLSGVVFGMMAFTAVLVPQLKIKCFFWILIYWRVFRINAIFIATWYFLWNLYDMLNTNTSSINYVAHVSGAIVGVLCGLFYRMNEPVRLRQVVGF